MGQQIQQKLELINILDHQTAHLTKEQEEQITNQERNITSQIQQQELQLRQLEEIQKKIKGANIQAQPQHQMQIHQQISQINLQQQQLQQSTQQLNQQLNQLHEFKSITKGQIQNTLRLDQIKNELTQLQEQHQQLMEKQLTVSLVIDVTITKIGNDILDILNKKVSGADLKSQLAFHSFYTNWNSTI